MSAAVTVFDLDGVLVSRDSMSQYVVQVLRRRPWLAPVVAGPAIALASTGRVPGARSVSARLVVRASLLARTVDQVRDDLADLGRDLAGRHAVQAAVESVRDHRRRGHGVVVATASAQAFARPFLDALALEDVGLVASGLSAQVGGVALSPHTYHAAKVRALAAAGWGERFDTVYSDSWADAPLLRRADRPVLVDPSPRTRRAAADLPGLRVVSWR